MHSSGRYAQAEASQNPWYFAPLDLQMSLGDCCWSGMLWWYHSCCEHRYMGSVKPHVVPTSYLHCVTDCLTGMLEPSPYVRMFSWRLPSALSFRWSPEGFHPPSQQADQRPKFSRLSTAVSFTGWNPQPTMQNNPVLRQPSSIASLAHTLPLSGLIGYQLRRIPTSLLSLRLCNIWKSNVSEQGFAPVDLSRKSIQANAQKWLVMYKASCVLCQKVRILVPSLHILYSL